MNLKTSPNLIFLTIFFVLFIGSTQAQTVTNGSVTGSPAANSGINAGNAPGWSGCGFSPDLCNVGFPSYSGNSSVTPVASPDGGTWLGMASLVECAQTSITGLTIGQSYTLYFCGANFGSGSSIFYGGPAQPIITIGTASQQFSIPQAASSWGGYSMTFTANAATMTLQITAPNSSGSYSNAGSYFAALDGFSLSPSPSSCTVLLDVEWEKITAQTIENRSVVVEWELAQERGFDYYKIERSIDGINFNTVATQEAIGNSSEPTAYDYMDNFLPSEIIIAGGPLYYRIKQFNIDGSFSYSAVAVVTILPTKEATMVIYPNPAQDKLTLDLLSTNTSEEATIQIYNITGQLVLEQRFSLGIGRSIQELNLVDLAAGSYLLRLTTISGKSYQRRFSVSGQR